MTTACAWCQGPIPAGRRRDSVTCSKRCRQARWSFTRQSGRAAQAAGPALRLAYADPPYPGRAREYYGSHPDYAGEVDHAALLAQLATYDGWALSTSAGALQDVLALAARGVRVASWHRGTAASSAWAATSAWEPVLYWAARPLDPAEGLVPDALVHGIHAMTTLPGRVVGAKPPAFSRWLFGLLGARQGDTLADLFPGSGAVSRAWQAFQAGEADEAPFTAERRLASLPRSEARAEMLSLAWSEL